jgi:integrase
LDLRPYGRVWSNRGIRIADAGTARRLLEQIRAKVADGRLLEEVLAEYLPADAKPNLVATRLEPWIELKRREVAAGDRSPTYIRELERYARPGGHFSWWDSRSIFEIDYAALEDWSMWLADRDLGPKTRFNVIAAFRSFAGWLKRRGEIREVPEFPWPKVPEYEPRVLTLAAQDALLDAIPEAKRGIFLALARMGLRPGEAMALEVADYNDGWLHVSKAVKGRRLSDPVRAPKNNRGKRLPIDPELEAWIEKWVPRERRLVRALLFENPEGQGESKRWAPSALRRTWVRACKKVGIHPPISLYEGTKHTFATAAKERGIEDRLLQRYLGHRDRRSVERYARLADTALIAVLRPREATPEIDDLSPGQRRPR